MWRKPEETKGKETEGNTGQQGRGDPWRSQYRDVKGKAETKYLKRMRLLRGRSHNSREMTKEEHEVPESSTRGNLGLRAQVTPGPCGVNRGGSSPMCGTPCCSHLVIRPLEIKALEAA